MTLGVKELIKQEVTLAMSEYLSTKEFFAGETTIPVVGKVFGEPKLTAAVQASLDFWLTSGPYSEEFESWSAKRDWYAPLVHGNLTYADRVINDPFWIGARPGLAIPMLDYMIESIHEILGRVK